MPCCQRGHVQGWCGAETRQRCRIGSSRCRGWSFQVQVRWPRQEVDHAPSERRVEALRSPGNQGKMQAVRVVEKFHACPVESTSATNRASHSADWEFPPARPGRLGGRFTALFGAICQKVEGHVCVVAMAKADHEGDKYAKLWSRSSPVCCGRRRGPVSTASSPVRPLWAYSNCLVPC